MNLDKSNGMLLFSPLDFAFWPLQHTLQLQRGLSHMSNLREPHFSLNIWLSVFKRSKVLKNDVCEKKNQRNIAYATRSQTLVKLLSATNQLKTVGLVELSEPRTPSVLPTAL